VRQPDETGRPVPCDPEIRYHFTVARSLGPAGREGSVADESEDVERRTELYTRVGGAGRRWREADPHSGKAWAARPSLDVLSLKKMGWISMPFWG
jgi:hypothetical protein